MKRRGFLQTTAASGAIATAAQAGIFGRKKKRPNVVLVITDDQGYGDLGCNGNPWIKTPNIDKLRAQSTLLNNYHVDPTCAPTRCAILSGIHPARAQKTHVVGGAPPAPHHLRGWAMISPWYSGRMPEDTVTIAKVLRSNGYATGHSGKWHMAINHHAFPQLA